MLDLILSWLAKILAAAIDLAIETILPVFGFDFTTFSNAFPFAATAYYIFQRVALAITLIVAVYHLFPFLMSWFGIRSEQLRTTPMRQMGQAVLAVITIYYGNYIMSTIIDIAQLPFSALLGAEAVDLSMDFEYGVAQGISDIFYQQSILLYVILIVMIGWSLIKVILEAVERYIVLYVLVYLSPLAAASLASEETSGIYKRFFSMFISQCLLLLLNVWSLKMGVSMFNNLSTHSSPILGLLMGYAFLRVAQKLDSYMNQLGLNAAITGAGLGNELFATGALLMGKLGGITGDRTAASGGAGGGGGILGFAKEAGQTYGRYSPLSAVSDAVRSQAAGVAQTVQEAAAVGANVYAGSSGTVAERISAARQAQKDYTAEHKDANIRTKLNATDNIFTRGVNDLLHVHDSTVQAMSQPNADEADKAEARDLVSVNAHSAGRVFDSFHLNGYETKDVANVTAVLDGLGASSADPSLAQFVKAGYNNIPQDSDTSNPVQKNLEYSMNRDGIQATYNQDGRSYNLTMLNSSQFHNLSRGQQSTYQNFRTSAGQTFYYKTSEERIQSSGKPQK